MSVIIEQSVKIYPSKPSSAGSYIARTAKVLHLMMERHRQRKQLARLDDRLLKDIGVSRSQACREYSKPFWR